MVDIKNIPAELKTSCRFCVWKFEKRNGQKTKMPYNPANGDRARINDLRTFADFKTTLVTYAMGGYDGIGIAVGSGIGAFDIDHCIREDGTLNDTADTVLSIFPTAYVEKSPSGKGLRGFFHVPEDYVYLHATFTKGTIEFRLFQFADPADGKCNGLHAGEMKAYIQLCLAMSQLAKMVRTASPKPQQTDNEKYAMRCWMLRLGFIGDEFATARDGVV